MGIYQHVSSFSSFYFFAGTVIIDQSVITAFIQSDFIRSDVLIFSFHLIPDVQN